MAYFTSPEDQNAPFFKVEGWVDKNMPQVLRFLVNMLNDNNVKLNNAGEIGVHHGRFFLALEELCDSSGVCDAFDVFEDQSKNLDGSGSGSMVIFLNNCRLYAKNASRIREFKVDSIDLNAGITCYEKDVQYELFSIDGCHTALHTCNDLIFAEKVLGAGGVVILDDISNMSWMGVFEGVVNYLQQPSHRLAPFGVGYNKLLLTTIGDQRRYFDFFKENICKQELFPYFTGGARVTNLRNFNIYRYGW